MSNQSRIQPGVPAGGQFSTSPRTEADISIADPGDASAEHTRPWIEYRETGSGPWLDKEFDTVDQARDWAHAHLGVDVADVSNVHEPEPDEWMRDRFGDDAEEIDRALNYCQLDDDQQRLLGTLLVDAEGLNSPAEESEQFDNCAHGGYVDIDDCVTIAGRLREHYEKSGTQPDFVFDLARDDDGVVSGYQTSVYLGHDIGGYLTDWHDVSDLGRSENTGLLAAVDAAEVIDREWRDTVDKAKRMKLIDADGGPIAPPANLADRWVSIPNPDDPRDMPIYEGPARGAAGRLIDGRYTAEDEDGRSFTVSVAHGNVAVPSDLGPTPEQEERFPKQDWQHQVGSGDTKLGYNDWVAHQVEMTDDDE